MNFQCGYIIDGISDHINEKMPNKVFLITLLQTFKSII